MRNKNNRLTKKEINNLFKKAVEKLINNSPYASEFIYAKISDSVDGDISFYIGVTFKGKYPNNHAKKIEGSNHWSLSVFSKNFDNGIQEIMGKLALALSDADIPSDVKIVEELEPETIRLLNP